MKTVFLDTVGLIALWDASDQWHEPASTAFGQFESAHWELVSSELVLIECGNAAARRPYRNDVVSLYRSLESTGRLIQLDSKDWKTAWRRYEESEIGGPGIVDCTSFVLMQRHEITEAFTNDRHFTTAGFTVLF